MKPTTNEDTPRDLTPCCGFARQAAQGDAYAGQLRVWFDDAGRMRCERCIAEILKAAEERLEFQARTYGARRRIPGRRSSE